MRQRIAIFSALFVQILWAGDAAAQCSAGTQISTNCGNITYEGCCYTESVVRWCENNVLCEIDCSGNFPPDNICGWNADYSFYDCGGSGHDPSGKNPCSCTGALTCPGSSCAGKCDSFTGICYCDEDCWHYGDCCPDVCEECGYCNGSCVPQCYGKECGPDGCGGSCGSCPWGWTCNAGKCVCTPNCAGKECGSDGCGGVCGWCPTGYVCNYLNKCEKQACQPDCFAKQCGDDGCGGSCGQCPPGYVCDVWGQCKVSTCTPNCQGKECGPDGCGGSCGTCPHGKKCINHKCETEGPCIIDCAGKECGADGCGGVCGVCAPPLKCGTNFKCYDPNSCIASCGEKECGLDGCGGICGTCPEGYYCGNDGFCYPANGSAEKEGDAMTAGETSVNKKSCPSGFKLYYGHCVPIDKGNDQGITQPGGTGCVFNFGADGSNLSSIILIALIILLFSFYRGYFLRVYTEK